MGTIVYSWLMWYSYLRRHLLAFIKISNAYFLWPSSGLEGGFCVCQETVMTHWVLGKYDHFYWGLTLCHPFNFLLQVSFVEGAIEHQLGVPLGQRRWFPAGRKVDCQRLMVGYLGTCSLPGGSYLTHPGQSISNDWLMWQLALFLVSTQDSSKRPPQPPNFWGSSWALFSNCIRLHLLSATLLFLLKVLHANLRASVSVSWGVDLRKLYNGHTGIKEHTYHLQIFKCMYIFGMCSNVFYC